MSFERFYHYVSKKSKTPSVFFNSQLEEHIYVTKKEMK